MKSRLKALMAETEKVDLGNFGIVEIEGLSFPELTKFTKFGEKKDIKGALDYLLFVTLRKIFPTVEDDEVEGMTNNEIEEFMTKISGGYSLKIIKTVQKLSGLLDEEDEKKVKEELEAKKEQSQSLDKK